ncbi:MAG: Gfo/Idh/MocA family protein, partial [Candidatus Zipacnadales bacterium]
AYIRLSDRIEVATQWLSWAGRSGPEWFLFPHTVDLANWLLGQRPLHVFASGHKGVLVGKGVPCYDIVQAQVVYEDAFVTLESSWVLPPSWPNINEFSLDLHGSEGKLTVVGDQENLTLASRRYDHPFTLSWLTEDVPIQEFVRCLVAGCAPGYSPLAGERRGGGCGRRQLREYSHPNKPHDIESGTESRSSRSQLDLPTD